MTQKLSGPEKFIEWGSLGEHYSRIKNVHLREYFEEDPGRGSRFSLKIGELYFDYSKNMINSETIDLLIKLAEKTGLREKISDMFSGKKINITEDRAVLHTALRNFSGDPVLVDGIDIMPLISGTLDKMKIVSNRIRSGDWKGFSGKKIKNVVNIGIGGSDLGPRFVCNALRWYSDRELTVRFVSNIDGTDLVESLYDLEPDETIFIIASKTFTTIETMTNAESAKEWVRSVAGNTEFISKHFIAITSSMKNSEIFGISADNTLEMWDWIGGRYSLTSSIGLSVMISAGYDNFISLLKGSYKIDEHFKNSPFNENIPVIMALIGIWYNNFFRYGSYAVLPYDQYLTDFPAYLQQCDMESNGKSVNLEGEPTGYHTGPVVWGGVGTNSQHAFFQLLHQGSRVIPADFIGFVQPLNDPGDHHRKFIANFFAQSKALAFGRTGNEVLKAGIPEEQIPFRIFPGNRPSNTLLFNKLTPETIGMLIALYEHKIFTQGIIWNINSFDQWGVELGKNIASDIAEDLSSEKISGSEHDSSTTELIKVFRSVRSPDEGN